MNTPLITTLIILTLLSTHASSTTTTGRNTTTTGRNFPFLARREFTTFRLTFIELDSPSPTTYLSLGGIQFYDLDGVPLPPPTTVTLPPYTPPPPPPPPPPPNSLAKPYDIYATSSHYAQGGGGWSTTLHSPSPGVHWGPSAAFSLPAQGSFFAGPWIPTPSFTAPTPASHAPQIAIEFAWDSQVGIGSYDVYSASSAALGSTSNPKSWILFAWDPNLVTGPSGGPVTQGNWTLLSSVYRSSVPSSPDSLYPDSPFSADAPCDVDWNSCASCAPRNRQLCSSCVPGWSDPLSRCSVRINPCDPNPCGPSQTCHPSVLDSYLCLPSTPPPPPTLAPAPPLSLTSLSWNGSPTFNPSSQFTTSSPDSTTLTLQFSAPLSPTLTPDHRAAIAAVQAFPSLSSTTPIPGFALNPSRAYVSGSQLVIPGGWETLAAAVTSGAVDNGDSVYLSFPPSLVSAAANPTTVSSPLANVTVTIEGVCQLPPATPRVVYTCFAGIMCHTQCQLGAGLLPSTTSSCSLSSPTDPSATGVWSGTPHLCPQAPASRPAISSILPVTDSLLAFTASGSTIITLTGSSLGSIAEDLHAVWYDGTLLGPSQYSWIDENNIQITWTNAGETAGTFDVATRSGGKVETPVEFGILPFPTAIELVTTNLVSDIQNAIDNVCSDATNTLSHVVLGATGPVYTGCSAINFLSIPFGCANSNPITVWAPSNIPAVIDCASGAPGLFIGAPGTTVRNMAFTQVASPTNGGGVWVQPTATGTSLHNIQIAAAAAGASGGAIALEASSVTATWITTTGTGIASSSGKGGSIYVGPSASGITLRHVSMTTAASDGSGGCIYLDVANAVLSDIFCSGGQASDSGGGIHATSAADGMQLSRMTCLDCETNGNGGAIISFGDTITIQDVYTKNGQARGSGGALALRGLDATIISPIVQGGGAEIKSGVALSLVGGGITGISPITIRDGLFTGVLSGYQGGAIGINLNKVNHHTVDISGSVFVNCSAGAEAGAIAVSSDSVTTVADVESSIIGNSFLRSLSPSRGGAIILSNARIRLAHNTFHTSFSQIGGAVHIQVPHPNTQMQVRIVDNVFVNNYALEGGGGVALEPLTHSEIESSGVYIDYNMFYQNIAAYGGGLSLGESTRNARTLGNVYLDNAAALLGGGVYIGIDVYFLIMTDEHVEKSFALFVGGGIFGYAGTGITMKRGYFLRNEAINRGGGIATFLGDLDASDSLFEENNGGSHGGAMALIQSVVQLTNVRLRNNFVSGIGGGLALQESVVKLKTCFFEGNVAEGPGGGLHSDGGGFTTIDNCTFEGNVAKARGGGASITHGHFFDCAFVDNAAADGGALFIEESSLADILDIPANARSLLPPKTAEDFPFFGVRTHDSVFFNNSAEATGGALAIETTTAHADVFDCSFIGNVVGVDADGVDTIGTLSGPGGGSMFINSKLTTIGPNVDVQASTAKRGAGGGCVAFGPATASVTVQDVTLSGCSASGDGGAVYVDAGASSVVLENMAISSSRSDRGGGGAYLAAPTTIQGFFTVTTSSALHGGGLYLTANGRAVANTLNIRACSSSEGGGVYAVTSAGLNGIVRDLVLVDNSAAVGGGGLFICYSSCGYPVPSLDSLPRITGSDSVGSILQLSGNTADYGPRYATDGARLEWREPPKENFTLGSIIQSVSTNNAISVALKDLFGNTVASSSLTSNEPLSLTATHPELGRLGRDVVDFDVEIGGVSQVFASQTGVTVFSNLFFALRDATPPRLALYADKTYEIRVEYDNVPDVFVSASVYFSSCLAATQMTVEQEGHVVCTPCPEGTTSSVANGECIPCPPGSFASERGLSSCSLCPAGSYTSDSGLASCTNCNPGEFSVEGATRCSLCPSGGFCVQGVLQPSAGWWDPSATLGVKPNAYYECPNQDACVNGACAPTYTGILCDVCVRSDANGETYAKVGKKCAKCPSVLESIVLICLGVVALFAVLLYFVRSATKAKSEVSILLKIAIDFAQSLALVSEFKSAAKSTFSRFFNFTQTATTSVNIFPVACIWEYRYYSTFMLYASFPVGCLAVCAVLYGTLFAVARFRARVRRNATESDLATLKAEYLGRAVSTMTVIYFLAYPSIVKHLFQVFPCYEDLGVLKADVTVVCYDATHNFFMSLGACALFLYCIVIPGTGWYLLRHNARLLGSQQDAQDLLEAEALAGHVRREDIRAATRWLSIKLERYKFLIDGYRPRAIYWEMLIISRKTLIVLVLVFLVETRNTQAVVGMFTLMLYALLHVNVKPFKSPTLNFAEFSSLSVLIITLIGSFAFIADVETRQGSSSEVEMDERISLGLIALNASFMIGILVLGIRAVRGSLLSLHQARRKAKAAQEAELQGDFRALEETSSLDSSYFSMSSLFEGEDDVPSDYGVGADTALVVMGVMSSSEDDPPSLPSSGGSGGDGGVGDDGGGGVGDGRGKSSGGERRRRREEEGGKGKKEEKKEFSQTMMSFGSGMHVRKLH